MRSAVDAKGVDGGRQRQWVPPDSRRRRALAESARHGVQGELAFNRMIFWAFHVNLHSLKPVEHTNYSIMNPREQGSYKNKALCMPGGTGGTTASTLGAFFLKSKLVWGGRPHQMRSREEGEGAKSALGNGDVAGKEQQLPAHSNQGESER